MCPEISQQFKFEFSPTHSRFEQVKIESELNRLYIDYEMNYQKKLHFTLKI